MSCQDKEKQIPPCISIVTTMYRSRPFLERFLAECLQIMAEMECADFEIVLVNDGSPDDSLAYAVARRTDIPQLVVMDLSRNFGHHYAMQAGLRHARGDLIFLIDCDLEISPLTLSEFKKKLDASDSDMVYGYQEARKGGFFEKASGGFFYKAFNFLSDIKIPENIATERIMTRRYVQAILKVGDPTCFWAAARLDFVSGGSSVSSRLTAVFTLGIYPNFVRCRFKAHVAQRRTGALETKKRTSLSLLHLK